MRREYPDAPIAGVGAVVIKGNQVLLVRRGQAPLKGEWSLPGGALELGETLRAGVVREVLEETGMVVESGSIVEVLDRITYDEQRVRYHYVLIDFVCRVTGGTLISASDADDSCWVEHSELEKYNLSPITLQVIEKAFLMEGKCFSVAEFPQGRQKIAQDVSPGFNQRARPVP